MCYDKKIKSRLSSYLVSSGKRLGRKNSNDRPWSDFFFVHWNRMLRQRSATDQAPSKTLIFHAGFRKTGTNSIQELFFQNSTIWRREVGISTQDLYPSTDALRHAGSRWSKQNNRLNASKFEAAAIRYGKALQKLPQSTIIVSNENIVGNNVLLCSEDIFAISARILGRLETILSKFELHFVIYTRDRTTWLKSCYSQDVKWHKFTGSFDDWLERNRNIRDWNEGYKALCSNLKSKLTFVRMEEKLNEEKILGTALLKLAGVSADLINTLKECPPQNKSLSPVQLEFIRKFNKLDMSYRVTHKVADVVSDNPQLFGGES